MKSLKSIVQQLLVLFIICLSSAFAKAQTMKQIDSVATMMCDHLKDLKIANDTARIEYLYKSQLYPYLETVERSKMQTTGSKIYYRMQRNCTAFSELLDRLEPPKEAVERLTVKPVPTITNAEAETFRNRSRFFYYEVNGDTTTVSMNEGKWQENFTDNTFSKLDYTWLNDTEFELAFIESNNEGRMLFSLAGDKYVYQLLAVKDGYYDMTVHIPGQQVYSKFRLYYGK
jgi:hypothetical protein